MKSFLIAAMLAFAGLAGAAPITDFTGPYDVANWTAVPGSGSVDVGAAPAAVTLTSGNAGSGNDVVTDFYVTVVEDAFFSFDWVFASADDPFFQAFGYLVGDSLATLTFGDLTNGLDANQSGSASVFATAGQIFGFRAISFQEGELNASTRIGNFAVTAVPEPGALALACLALLGAAAATRARRAR